jgi:restriction system protein
MKQIQKLTPTEFERYTRDFLQKLADSKRGTLESFDVEHLEELSAHDGDYKIDVTARLRILGFDFLMLVECKHLKRPVEREAAMVLWAKQQSLHAQKCIMFSISGFQEGALEYAKENRMALIHIMDGQATYLTRSATPIHRPEAPPVSYWLAHPNDQGKLSYSSLNENSMEPMKNFFLEK